MTQASKKTKLPLTIVLDNIRSAYNVGSILRTGDCAGISKVITCGYTPQTTHPKVKKTALGAEDYVESQHYKTLAECIDELIKQKYEIYALETGEDSQNLWEVDLPEKPTALIVGNEVDGIQPEILTKYNLRKLLIPMYGQKESLNVANASAIAIYQITQSWR